MDRRPARVALFPAHLSSRTPEMRAKGPAPNQRTTSCAGNSPTRRGSAQSGNTSGCRLISLPSLKTNERLRKPIPARCDGLPRASFSRKAATHEALHLPRKGGGGAIPQDDGITQHPMEGRLPGRAIGMNGQSATPTTAQTQRRSRSQASSAKHTAQGGAFLLVVRETLNLAPRLPRSRHPK